METIYYKLVRIEGEYAILVPKMGSEELFIAMALLPMGVDVGSYVKYEMFCYEIVTEEEWNSLT